MYITTATAHRRSAHGGQTSWGSSLGPGSPFPKAPQYSLRLPKVPQGALGTPSPVTADDLNPARPNIHICVYIFIIIVALYLYAMLLPSFLRVLVYLCFTESCNASCGWDRRNWSWASRTWRARACQEYLQPSGNHIYIYVCIYMHIYMYIYDLGNMYIYIHI